MTVPTTSTTQHTQQAAHGGEAYRVARALGIAPETLLDLGTNANILCADLTRAIVAAEPYPHEHYPDLENTQLREALAQHESVSPTQVVAGNGSAELLWLTLQALRPARALLLGPLFSEYERACTALHIPFDVISPPAAQGYVPHTAELHAIATSSADMVILCTPNNPGTVVYDNMHAIVQACGERTVLIDNTYREFLWGTPAYAANAWQTYRQQAHPNARLITLHSLTKFFHCPGIRLGYALTDAATATHLQQVRAPWMVSTFAEHMGMRLIASIDAYRQRLPLLRAHGSALRHALAATGVFQGLPLLGVSFLTGRLRSPITAATVREHLLQQHILVRNCDNITGMEPGHIRIQIRSVRELRPLLDALTALA